MIRGITVVLCVRNQASSGTDAFNRPVYAETEVAAADGENLTRREREWVEAYFTLLTAQE